LFLVASDICNHYKSNNALVRVHIDLANILKYLRLWDGLACEHRRVSGCRLSPPKMASANPSRETISVT